MKQIDIARQVGITPIHLNAVLAARRNPSARLAVKLEQATGVARTIWIFGTAEERRAAWAKFREEARTARTGNPQNGEAQP